MKIMTKEYCERCPFFNHNLGYIEAGAPYWQKYPANCVCAKCPHRTECEQQGPRQLSECIKEEILDRVNDPAILRKILKALGEEPSEDYRVMPSRRTRIDI